MLHEYIINHSNISCWFFIFDRYASSFSYKLYNSLIQHHESQPLRVMQDSEYVAGHVDYMRVSDAVQSVHFARDGVYSIVRPITSNFRLVLVA